MKKMNPSIQVFLEELDKTLDASRLEAINKTIAYCQKSLDQNGEVHLNFICTHNSRRSQFSQIWAQVAAYANNVNAYCYSGGVEITAFNERAVASLKRAGFAITSNGGDNPHYNLGFSQDVLPIVAFSKLVDDESSPTKNFAAIMTCSHADENCPFIPGADERIPLRYEDPKAFDDTPLESEKYDERSKQIASEMFYIFSNLNH